jgi:hypothetical protein
MIIKKWDSGTSTFSELYPKTKASMLYADDGTTTIFDTNTKIKLNYLPDAVFDSLYFYSAISGTTSLSALTQLIKSSATTNKRTPTGYYSIAATSSLINGVIDITNPSNATLISGSYYIGAIYASDEGTVAGAVDDYVASTTLETGDWIVCQTFSGTGTAGDPYVATFAVVENTYENATDSAPGIVKYGSSSTQTTAANAVTTTASRSYAVQNNGSNQMLVNVPWVNTTYAKATSSVLGLVELFDATVQTTAANAVTTTASRTYGVQLNADDQMVVNVPWVDTNTTYAKATSSVLGLVELFSDTVQTVAATAVSATASRTYGIQLNSNDQAVVNVPWTDTTYSKATATSLGLVELFNATVQTVAANTVSTTASRSYGIQLNSDDQMVVNVPWTDTTYAAGAGITLSSGQFSHTDTSSVANSSNANGVVLQSATFDTYGHVQTVSTIDLDGRYFTETEVNTSLAKRKEFYVQASAPTPTENDAIWFDI